ncbi:MAG: hypothetical protein JW934_17745 [Anaerolineae bacterium]|nr:hypothetical protein [Anaerolineae bacterium]
MKQCAYCGAEVPGGKIVCPACGKSLFRLAALDAHPKPAKIARRLKVRPIPAAVGVLCLLFGVFIVWLFGLVTVIACTRVEPSQVDCRVYDLWAGWLPMGRLTTVSRLRSARARIEVSDYEDQMDRTYVELSGVSQTEQVSWSSLPTASNAAEQINHFIRDSQAREIKVRDVPGWFEISCGAFLFADLVFFSVLLFRGAVQVLT